MVQWAAANIAESPSKRTENASRKSSETVEAALARLTKAYSAALSCVGAMHKLQAAASKDETKLEEFKSQSQKLATAARTTFEKAILLDPLIAAFCPTWTTVVNELASNTGADHWSFVSEPRPEPAVLTSSSHKSTVSGVAYLSLLNYADLLVASQQPRDPIQDGGILGSGVVKPLPLVGWNEDSDQQLALVSLCDACDLDGSDPVVWLKLACAARRYSRILGEPQLKYRRLERHALEMGKTALPPSVPPNRSILRALEEHTSMPEVYSDNRKEEALEATKLVLDLPRYSWSILGRMLIRACREGSSPNTKDAFGSPCVELRISPMLVLPERSLGLISKYLESEDIWRFEATCRGLSAAILSARASLEREEAVEKPSAEQHEQKEAPTPSVQPEQQLTDTVPQVAASSTTQQDENKGENRIVEPARSRSSKRVRSQLITSGKRTERESRRSSVEFCLLASTLHCTADEDDYQRVRGADVSWETLYNRLLSATSLASKGAVQKVPVSSDGGDSRLGDSCLTAFLLKWSAHNSGPFDVLQRYVAHVALNVADVFTRDQDSLALSSFITDCVDLLAKRQGMCYAIDLCSYGNLDLSPRGAMFCLEYLAVNVLNAELRLKRSDGQLAAFGDYDADGNYVSVVVPQLIHQLLDAEEAHSQLNESRVWIGLKTRLHWLAAGFYLERSRLSQNISESRSAEDLGIDQVERTIECLSLPVGAPILTVNTPHLTSPRRIGSHWKVLSLASLNAFRDDIQASSVVSGARQQFLEKLTEIEKRWETSEDKIVSEADMGDLQNVGKTLFTRYNVSHHEEGGKYEELLDDFIASCEEGVAHCLKSSTTDKRGMEGRWGSLWSLAPSGEPYLEKIIEVPNPSILTILMTCLWASEDGRKNNAKLLTRLTIVAFELLSLERKGTKEKRGASEDEFDYMSDDDLDIFSDDEGDDGGPQGRGNGKGCTDHRKNSLIAVAADFFIEKLNHILGKNLTESEKDEYAASDDCLALMKSSMTFVSTWYEPRGSRRSALSIGDHDLRIFCGITTLKGTIMKTVAEEFHAEAEAAYFVGLSRVILHQRHLFPVILKSGNDSRSGRSTKQKEYLGRAELLGAVASEFASVLSRHTSMVTSGSLNRSALIGKMVVGKTSDSSADSLSLTSLVEALLYLWNIIPRNDTTTGGSVLGRIATETLLVPVSACLVAICGSGLCSGSKDVKSSSVERLSLTEFFDSDASANECDSDEEDSSKASSKSVTNFPLLQPLCQAIQCVSLVVGSLDEKYMSRYSTKTYCEKDKGPLFPLVATRVLSFQADLLLSEFGNKSTIEENLWQISFPYGTQTIGALLDTALHRVYKHLYGFTIHGSCTNQEKEKSIDNKSPKQQPESTKAAAQLYRCIQRAYATSRKSVPQAALESVALALPEAESSPRRNLVRNFVFSKETKGISAKSISQFLSDKGTWDQSFVDCYDATKGKDNQANPESFKDDVLMVRKGIVRELAEAQLPNISQVGTDTTKSTKSDDQQISEERSVAAFQERELSKKFWAIVDDMCYRDPSQYQGWLRAAECLTLKAELIADRLGSSLGFVRVSDFSIPTDIARNRRKLFTLSELMERQEREYNQTQMDWIPFIGDDLSVYIDFQWSSFSSLENCARTVTQKYRELASQIVKKTLDSESSEYFETHVWNDIETLYKQKDFPGWQQAWGGMFVEALRTMALRCTSMGLFLLGKNKDLAKPEEASFQSEILESLGISKYTELMGSQGYGYPMRALSCFRKRELAEVAQHCFKAAASKVANDNDQVTYDLLFMVGKCFEKVAKTYALEAFSGGLSSGEEPSSREYSRNMKNALEYYHNALEEATQLEEEGALPDVQNGGSSHGKTEVVYRLHASRLKCLISAVQNPENVRVEALLEAAKLTSCFWFDQSNGSIVEGEMDINVIIWRVLADVVAALAQCRIDHHFFHRSVYRYAQALMWAPALHDSPSGMVSGSLGVVPATKSHLVRGLNSSTACVNSAEVVMGTLFERKRPQIVSVWVTTASSSPSPLETINLSTRKFDAIRGKYLQAYIETSRLCQRASVLEALYQNVANTKRDLPSFYQASALAHGGIPEAAHAKDDLLRKVRSFHTVGLLKDVKRSINRALAGIVIHEIKSGTAPKTDFLRRSYACFLRLNTTPEEIERMRSWKYSDTAMPDVEALCKVYLTRPESRELQYESSNWSGGAKKTAILKAAVKACSEQYPGLPNILYRKSKTKKAPNKSEVDGNEDDPESRKRSSSEAASNVQQFVVDVPTGLSVGDKFETTVKIGSQMKTLRLTVPEGLPPKLKFSLAVPNLHDDPSPKRQKEDL